MDTIRLETWIDAPVERCFLLSLSVDLHLASARSSREHAVEGVTTGLISEGEMVTFRGRHLGLKLRHKSRIEVVRPYSYFRDVMVSGVFSHFEHEHHFAAMDDGTRLRDEIRFTAPWGAIGRLATKILVKRHLTSFLLERNAGLKIRGLAPLPRWSIRDHRGGSQRKFDEEEMGSDQSAASLAELATHNP
jgi:ligand-binding SRPBCC domain-containing protein